MPESAKYGLMHGPIIKAKSVIFCFICAIFQRGLIIFSNEKYLTHGTDPKMLFSCKVSVITCTPLLYMMVENGFGRNGFEILWEPEY